MLKYSYNIVGFAQLKLRSGENMLGFAQISWVLLISISDFLLRSREFGTNLATIRCFFAYISWVWQKSDNDLIFILLRSSYFHTNPAKIRQKIQITAQKEPLATLRRLRPTRPPNFPIQSDLTRWFLQLVVGFLGGNPI